MTEDILINVTPFETRVAIVEQGAVQELHVERSIQRGHVGNIYLGRVNRVLPGMQSAFVDIGLERAAFLHIADLRENRQERTQGQTITPIEKILFEGQTIMVQVIKDPLGTKGARLSSQISLAGRMLVHLPHDPHIGISQKIESQEERKRLKQQLTALLPEDPHGGFILRTQAEGATDEELAADVEYLLKLWQGIQQSARKQGVPSLLHQDLTLAERVLRDIVTPNTGKILVDSRSTKAAMTDWAQVYTPALTDRIQHYSGERPLFDTANVDEEIARALSRRVDLKSGGYLIIDQTEALTTVDVNTGSFIGGRNFDDTVFKTNLEAARAIARQLRLRNLGGIIIIDFIDMDDPSHRDMVLQELQKALSRDRTRMTINGYTQLGLVEMTRKRTRDSLAHQLCEPCPVCEARGSVRTARTICYEILREILREARQFNPKEFRIVASQAVIDLLLEEESQHMAMLGDFVTKPISMEVEPIYPQEKYDIILL
ncbi:ribonuclease G [Kerstersia gyiorum]|jgi:ribonuclease G|uniref:RNAse G n=1 Tax=Kerstersia gyiorum TaxID=206506 RepID=A0A171KP95_9BURK|nr:ribonuclease G [Kerstersia gyiorum]AZV93133.1 ribonuclease E/G [Bordetella sp. J329]MCO7636763.1 ribonuclease G [Pseudomonas sp. S 311-6]KAB0544298.1 ribonuclease G [Kerstersia gyiorum]KKO70712.1 ribonuclease [Kerstersia gyiorum]MCH4272577.1 ribonuclease G [Kerstersia gyiorum]